MVEAGFVKHAYAQVFLLTIGFGHLEEGIDLADCRDVVGDERLYLSLEVDLLRFVTLYVLEHLLQLL